MRSLSVAFMVVSVLAATWIVAFDIQPVKTATMTITVPDDYPTIQAAINAATGGDTVFVRNGTYYENVVVNKTLSLIGENREGTIIDGSHRTVVVKVISNSVNQTGFTVRNSGENGADYVGLSLSASSCNISNNIVEHNVVGISVTKENNFLADNLVANNTHIGIFINFSTHNLTLQRNNMNSNGFYNFYVVAEGFVNASEQLAYNIDTSNLVDGKPIYYLVNQQNTTINPETCNNIGFLALVNCSNVTVENLSISSKVGQAVLLAGTSNSLVTNLNVSFAHYAIELFQSHHNTVSDNALSEGSIRLTASQLNNITENTVQNFTGFGIGLGWSSYNHVKSNCIMNCDYGIQADFSKDNTFIGNSVLSSSYSGIYLPQGNENNTFMSNTVSYNKVGIEIWPHYHPNRYNRIVHNNFVNNARQIDKFLANACAFWDDGYPSGGNYWSDYNGTDLFSGPYQNDTGSDGIFDLPYVIGENNTDHYPLAGPWTTIGENITVTPATDVAITFSNVTSAGVTTANIAEGGFTPPTGFKLAGSYYDVETTADYNGTIKLTIAYDDSNLTSTDETNLQLMQWNASLEAWQDLTTWVDTNSNLVYGETTSLSWFAAFLKLLGDIDVDGDVDIFDIVYMANLYGVSTPDPRYERKCDINRDGSIDIYDIVIAAGHYGESWS